jgi:hypothetical protein
VLFFQVFSAVLQLRMTMKALLLVPFNTICAQSGGVRNTTAKHDGVFATELQLRLICILLWPSEHQRQSVSAKINTLIYKYSSMGIKCLFPHIKKYGNKVHISEFYGRIVVVDASCWTHKALAISLSQHGNLERWVIIGTILPIGLFYR